MRISDWSSDVCSSDLWLCHCRAGEPEQFRAARRGGGASAMEKGRAFRDDRCPRAELGRTHGPDRAVDLQLRRTVLRGLPDGNGDSLRSEEHTSELQSLMRISYAVFCLKKKNENTTITKHHIIKHNTNKLQN